jgi:hypothetical protein
MQILVEIDETDKQEIDKLLKGRGLLLLDNAQLIKRAVLAVFHGTPLPKGHGRIADIDKVLEEMKATRTYDIPFALERVKPIIEADRSEKK